MKEVPVRPTSPILRIPALLGATVLLTAALAGCTGVPGLGGCTPDLTGGDASSIVTATGDVGTKPTVDFPTPLVASSKPEVTILETGDGEPVAKGSQVDYDFTVLAGETGDLAGQSGYDGTQFARVPATDLTSVSDAMQCVPVGSRISLVTTWADAKDAFGSQAASAFGDTETVVMVLDVLHSYLGKADGINQLPRDGAPTVVTAVDGTPGITVPLQDPPTAAYSSAIKAGNGAKVDADDKVVMHYSLWTWPEGGGTEPGTSTSTWGRGIAPTYTMTSFADGGGLPAGVVTALVGQKIGSQVLIVIPPGDGGFVFGGDNSQIPAGVTETSTTIWVVDLLGIQK